MFSAMRIGVRAKKGSAAPALPQITGQSTWTGTSDTTSHSITMPSGIVAGELLLCVATFDGNTTLSASGWTNYTAVNYLTFMTQAVFTKIAAGADTLTIECSANQRGTAVVYRIGNANTVEVSSKSGTTSGNTFTSPTLTLSQTRDFLCIASLGLNGTNTCTADPSNYTGFTEVQPASTVNDPTYTCYRTGLTGSSVAPGDWTCGPAATIGSVGFTIAAYQA